VVDAITKPYMEAWARGDYGEALEHWAIDIGNFFVCGVGVTGKAGEAVAVYRVQGGVGNTASRRYISIDANGNPIISFR